MLVLTRKTRQQIHIGPDITVTILQIKGQAVRVGIEAPQEVCVLRSELADRDGAVDKSEATDSEPTQRGGEMTSRIRKQDASGRSLASAQVTARCRVPRVDATPTTSPYQAKGPASFLPTRRRRFAIG